MTTRPKARGGSYYERDAIDIKENKSIEILMHYDHITDFIIHLNCYSSYGQSRD